MINFIIPIRHPSQVKSVEQQKQILMQTVRSIEAQSSSQWRCVIVANREMDLPELPNGFYIKWVDFEPNQKFKNVNNLQEFYEAVRSDKGLRVLEAAKDVKSDEYIMVIDDDDLIHRNLVDYVTANHGLNWYVGDGYRWNSNRNTIDKLDSFHRKCGTSLIVKVNDYLFYEEAISSGEITEKSIDELGSHILIFDRCKTNFSKIPFRAAIYRCNHANASQKIVELLKLKNFNFKGLLKPIINEFFVLLKKDRVGKVNFDKTVVNDNMKSILIDFFGIKK